MGFVASGGGGNTPDNSTLEENASGQLQVKAAGILASHIGASIMVGLGSGTIQFTNTTLAQKATVSIAAGELAAGDLLYCLVLSTRTSGANKTQWQQRLTNNSVTHTSESADGNTDAQLVDIYQGYLFQHGGTNTKAASIEAGGMPISPTITNVDRQIQSSGHNADWITEANTWELWAKTAGGTVDAHWFLFAVKQ